MHVLWVLIASQLVIAQSKPGVVTRPQVYGVYRSRRPCERSKRIPKIFGGSEHGTVRCVEVVNMRPGYWAPAE